MKAQLSALPLILAYSGFIKNKKVEQREIYLPSGTRAFHFFPLGKNPNSLPGIYIQHGMSVMGIDDPRIIDLSINFAHCNFSVILPELNEVKGLLIDPKTISHIQNLIFEIPTVKHLYNGEQFGYLSASFSGGMGLIAASRNTARSNLKSMMLIGSYCDFNDTVKFVFQNYDKDTYGVLVVLYNMFRRLSPDLNNELEHVFYEAALDNGLRRPEPLAPKLLAKTSKNAQNFFKEFESSESFRKKLGDDILGVVGDLPTQLSPFYQIKSLKSPVSLLHGADDPVISPLESGKLAQIFEMLDITYTFRTSTALTHGDSLPLHSQIFGVPALLETFGCFIDWLNA
ncbi:alpha/beta hydrolase [Leptospira sp. 96542]|nr:alpha/beta hydrolase [Leptospira sp. 96542]